MRGMINLFINRYALTKPFAHPHNDNHPQITSLADIGSDFATLQRNLIGERGPIERGVISKYNTFYLETSRFIDLRLVLWVIMGGGVSPRDWPWNALATPNRGTFTRYGGLLHRTWIIHQDKALWGFGVLIHPSGFITQYQDPQVAEGLE